MPTGHKRNYNQKSEEEFREHLCSELSTLCDLLSSNASERNDNGIAHAFAMRSNAFMELSGRKPEKE